MANCQVKYDSEGNIQTVYDKAGNESQLFLSIAKLPMVKNLEEALEIYKQTYAKGISDHAEIVITGGFKSNISEALENIKDKNVKNIKGWMNQLTDVQKTGVRYVNQEIEWIGLEDYLKDWVKENKPKNGNVPFDVIDQYVKDNQIEIEEVTKTDIEMNHGELVRKLSKTGYFLTGDISELRYSMDGSISRDYEIVSNDTGKVVAYNSLGKNVQEIIDKIEHNSLKTNSKYAGYQLEGGENYREVLLTLPKKKGQDYAEKMRIKYGENLDPVQIYEKMSESERETQAKLNNESEVAYKSTHWDEANVLAHIRLNERTLPNGERVLFVEEFQSDWAQEGRDKGFAGDSAIQKEINDLIKKEQELLNEAKKYTSKNEDAPSSITDEYTRVTNRRRGLESKAINVVPDMPYKNTDQWLGMSIRRVMQVAAQEGFDRVAWVTGEQSADRYSLKEQVNSITVNPSQNGRFVFINMKGNYDVTLNVDNNGKIIEDKNNLNGQQSFMGKDLEDVVGKDMAQKILEETTENKYEGDGLEVGGEGMKAFYNQIVPKVALKEAQRFDKKSKVEVVDLSLGKGSWMMDVTKEQLENWGTKITEQEAKDYKFKDGEFIATIDSRGNIYRLYDTQDIKDAGYNNDIYTVPNLIFSKQLSIKITPRAKASLLGAVPLFQKDNSSEEVAPAPKEMLEGLIDRLNQTSLSERNHILNEQEIVNKLIELGIPEDMAFQVVSYHGRTRPINNFERQGKPRKRYGEILSGIYFGESYIAAAFAGVDSFSGNESGRMAKARIDDSDFYTIDMKGTTPSGDASLIDVIGGKEWDKIKSLKDSGKIKGLKLLNTREFLAGEEGPTTQYVAYDNSTVEVLREYAGAEIEQFVPRFDDFLFSKGIQSTPNGFVYQGEVYINSDKAGLDTPIHEFGHLWNSWAKENKNELYNRGIELIEEQGQEYIDFVKANQPKLEGDAILEEALAQAIGDNGAKIVEESKAGGFKQWLSDLWKSIAEAMGISQYKESEVANLSLDQFARAVAIDLLSGEVHRGELEKIRSEAIANGTFMKAPNGNNTNLSEQQWLQTRTENFKKWFGDWQNNPESSSKVVDSNGEPLVVYRGDNTEFTIFDRSKTKGARYGKLFNLTSDKPFAYQHGNLRSFFVNSRNPLDLDNKESIDVDKLIEGVNKELGKPMDKSSEDNFRENPYELINIIIQSDKFITALSYAGYTGVQELSYNGVQAVINPNQIKSATDNTGAFSKENEDIRYSNIDNYNTVRMSRGSKNRADNKISVNTPYLRGEISRLSKVEEVNKDGATLNLDGTKYTGGGLAVPITSINSTQNKINTKVVEDFIEKNRDKIGSDIVKFGLYKFPEQDTVSIDLSIAVPAKYKKIALEFGRLAGQESLYNFDTGKYEPTGADGMNPKEFSAEEFSSIAASLSKGILPDVVSKGEVVEGNKKFNEPLPEAEVIAREYMESIGESYEDFQRIEKNDISLARAMSNTFEELKHSPDSETIAAYEDMAEQTIAQYEAIVKHGYEIEVNNTEPYSSSGEMIEDLRQNKNMKIFSTESGFGDTAITEEQRAEDPRLRRTEFTDKNGVPLLINDVFRFVHDFFGHAVLGNGFGPIGEENAWQMHVRMFTGDAKKAMTTETRGQNSWVNFSGVNDKAFEKRDRARALRKEGNIEEANRLSGEVYNEMMFAEQKLALSPNWMVRPDAKVEFLNEAWENLTARQQAEHLGYEVDTEGSKVADGEGNFKFSKRTSVPVNEVVDRSIMTPSELKLLDFWGDRPILMYGGRSQSEGIAMYNRTNRTISINVNNELGGMVLSNQTKVNGTIVHEIIHHLANTKVQDKKAFNKELSSIREEIVRNKHLASPYVQNIIGHMEKGSPEEVITYALSDSAVAEFLNSIDSDGIRGNTQEGTIWSRFVKAILDALRGNSLLGDVANVLDRYMDSMESETDFSSGEGTYYMSIEPELSVKGADSYRDALNKGQDIEIGVETRDGFKTLITIPYNVNPETVDGFINKYIKEGFLKEERTIKNGKAYYTADGINYLDRKNKELMLEDDLNAMLGAERSSVKDGLIEIKEEVERAPETPKQKAIKKDLFSELFKSHNVGNRRNAQPKKISEKELKLKLMTLLNKMGVETMSIAEYVEKYNKKNGVDPSVRALADAANRVIAFKDGIITLEDLTEEVMHIIVETLSEAETEGILRNIHQTSEYAQHAKEYTEVYTKAYPKLNKEQIEQLVRKEILGKVLKNSTLANLNTEESSQKNFYDRAIDYIKNFFNKIVGGQELQQQLSRINEKIEDLFVQENLSEYLDNNLNSEVFPMYSIGSQPSGDRTLDLARSIQKSMLNSLKNSYLNITKEYGALYADKVRVQKLGDMVDNVTQASAASDFIGLIKRQTDYVKRAVDNAERENTALSIQARQVLVNLNDSLKTLLEKQRDVTEKLTPEQLGLKTENMSEAEGEAGKRALIAKITETLTNVSKVSGEASNVFDSTFDDIIERISQRHDLSPKAIEHLTSQANMMNKEIGFFMETFGQLIHSSDALLNIAAHVVEEMWGKHANMTQKRMRKFAKVMEANGVNPEQLSELFDRGFVVSQYDFPKFQNKMKEIELDIYNTIFKDKQLTQEEYDNHKKEGTLERYNDAQNNTAQRMKSEALTGLVEKRMNGEYYEKQAKKYEALGVSKYTIDQLKALSLQRAIVQEAATDDSGKVIYTEVNKDELDALSQTRKEYKSIVDSFGTLKQGYTELSKEEARARGIDPNVDSNQFLELGNLIYVLEDGASNEAKLSFEMHLIDKDFQNNGKQRNIEDFIDKFVEITHDQGLEKGISFLENNIGVSFSSQFWDSISSENILDNVDVNLQPGNPAIIKRIRQKRNRLSQLKKLYQDPMNPQEVKGNEMSVSEQEIIKNLVEEIEVEMNNLQIPDSVERTTSFDSEVDINQSYRDILAMEVKNELGKEEFKFIRKHLTSQNEAYLIGLEGKAIALDSGTYFGSDKVRENLEKHMEDGDTYYQAFVRMARTKVLPYYKRYTPEGYKTIKEVTSEITSDQQKQNALIDYISQMEADPNYELNIHYTFDAQSQDINPNWDKDFEGGFEQPKLSEFLNEKFVKMFDPEIVNGKFTGVVRRNQKLYNVQQALLELQGENLDSIGQRGSANIYKVPQISRTSANQVADLLSKSGKGLTMKEILKDTFSFRVDDLEYGNAENNAELQRASDTRTIPTFYTRDLENAADVSDDLFYSYAAMTNQAVLHQVRREGITDIRAVEDKMLNRANPQGKMAQATRNYKMLKSYIDYNYYGVKESTSYKVKLPIINKEVDLTKVLRLLHRYVKFRNLGLNFIVPFTSYITAEVNTQIEATLGEYFSRDSMRLASREFGKLVRETGFTKNSLSYNDKSKINVLGEWLGVYNMSEKAANAKYSTLMRWLPKVGMVLHQVGNFPIIPRVFLSIMFDNRVVNGKLISRKQFLDSHTDKKAAKSEWKTFENKSLYHFLDIKETGVEYKPELLAELGGDQAYLDTKMQRVRSLIKDQVEKIDGMIPESQRVEAQRNAVYNYLMTHRGWLAIGAQKRLKGLQLNLETGQMEEGTYITMRNLLYDFLGELGGGDSKTWNLVKAMKKAYEGKKNNRDPELVARNMKRMGVELAFLTGIVFMLAAVTAMADDEENKDLYALQLTNYFMWRLANETSSTQLGLFTELSGVIESPIVAYKQVQNMGNIAMIFDDEYKGGTYKGHSGLYKYLHTNTVGLKSLHDMKNIRNTRQTYIHYNRENIDFSSMGIFTLLHD